MASDLRLGYKASAEQFGPQELLDLSVRAEELGLDIVAVSDHFQPWPPVWRHGWKWSETPTMSSPSSSARTERSRSSCGANCSADAL